MYSQLIGIFLSSFSMLMLASEDDNAVIISYQPKPLSQIVGYKLAKDYQEKPESQREALLQKWMAELPSDAWNKIRDADPLTFLHFKKMDLLMSNISHMRSEGFNNRNWYPALCGLHYQYGHLEKPSYGRYYILINNITGHIEKKVWARSQDCHYFDVSDSMFVWAFDDSRKISIFNAQNNTEYSSTIDDYTWKALSNTECGVFYLFHEDNKSGNKTLKKMVCTAEGSKILHTIDISFWKNCVSNMHLIQTSNPHCFFLHDVQSIYAYNTIDGDLTKMNIPFSFDTIHVNSIGSLLAFTTTSTNKKTYEEFFAKVSVFAIDDLHNPLYVLNDINVRQLTFMKHTNLLIFFNEHGSYYYDPQVKELKNLNSYDLVFKRQGLNPLVVRDAANNDFYFMTDHFEMMQQKLSSSISNQNN